MIKKPFSLLFFFWLCVHLILFIVFGIYTKEEATKYINEAGYLITHGSFSEPKYLFYSGYIFIHLLTRFTSFEIILTYLIQLLLNGFATICFYRLVQKISGERSISFAASLLLIICIPFQLWTNYLFTESVFFSLIIIYVWLLMGEYTPARIVLLVITGLLVLITRPTGVLIIPATLVYLSAVFRTQLIAIIATWLVAIAAFIFLVNIAMKGKGEFDFALPILGNHIICGLPVSDNSQLILSQDTNSLNGLLYYIIHNPAHFLKLASLRIVAFFGLSRSYYSTVHNLALILFFYPMYFLALLTLIKRFHRFKPFILFTIALILTFAISVSLTCDDWHNRFIMPVIPFMLALAAFELVNIVRKLRKTA